MPETGSSVGTDDGEHPLDAVLRPLRAGGTGSSPFGGRLVSLADHLPERAARLGAAVVASLLLAAVGWWLLRPPPPPIEQTLPRARPAAGTPSSADARGEGSAEVPTTTVAATVVVHAAGAVQRPGIYRLAAGARVDDLISAAGGLAAGADSNRLNLAAPLLDGERIYAPRKGEQDVPQPVGSAGPPSPGSGSGAAKGVAPSGPLDLNTATADQLDTLPGVGPSTARAILDFRSQHGRFRSVDDLLDVRGIGDAKLAELRAKVRV